MIFVKKLMTLSPGHRMRKAAQSLERAESALRAALGVVTSGRLLSGEQVLGQGDSVDAPDLRLPVLLPWLQELGSAFSCDASLTASIQDLSRLLHDSIASLPDFRSAEFLSNAVRTVNRLRRTLECAGGIAPADWDFESPLGLPSGARSRRIFPGMRVFLEDIRSPFNVGSMFRSADAFGVSEILISGFTADVAHPRAERSAMGAIATVPWHHAALAELADCGEIIALELRGEPIEDFRFPEKGIILVGSEELGVSPDALALCKRTVTIPMLGTKGSLNVGVAFGVLLNAWRSSLQKQGIAPVQTDLF